ncbi:MAG: hypothetical protein WBL14_00690 [Caldicoprobacterales bacterium]
MVKNYRVPWERYGVIAYLAKVMEEYNVQFGKTSLQKIIYILQEIYDVKIGYPYTLYNYGPYSADLANDLNYIAALKGVKVSWVSTGGYSIKPDVVADDFINRGIDFINSNKDKIKSALDVFGRLTAKELELRATIVYFYKEYGIQDEHQIAQQVHEIKPYFSLKKIEETIHELKEKAII